MMRRYVQFAWLSTLGVAVFIGVARGGWFLAVLPLAAMLAWAAYWRLGRSQASASPRSSPVPSDGFRSEFAQRLAHGLTVPAAIVSKGLVTCANAACLDLFEQPEGSDRIAGMPLAKLVHPRDRERLAMLVASATQERRPGTAKVVAGRPDGKNFVCEITALQLDAAPGMMLLQFNVPDTAELARSGDDRQLEGLLDGLQQAVFHIDVEGRCVYLSRAWEVLTGFTVAETAARPLASFFHPDDHAELESALKRVAGARGGPLLTEARLVAGSGNLHWVELRASARLAANGEATGAVGSLTEITRRKQLEESLRSSRRHLNTLLANVPGMVYRGLNDRDWTMEFVSDGSVELTGYAPREFIDKARRSFGDLIHPEDREFVWALVQTQLAQSKPYQLSYRIIDAAGETKWVWEQGRGIFSSSGELLALEGFITDVSARRGAEEEAKRRLWFDARTGLASLAIFNDRLGYVLEHASFTGYPCAVFLVDFDDFAALNARYGYDFGDRLLAQLARRFKVVQGPGTTVARSVGDEFVVLLTDFRLGGAPTAVPAAREVGPAAMRLAERLGTELAKPLRMEGHECHVTASIGVAIGPSGHASTDAMMQAARKALAAARAAGPGNWRMADE
ncbi:MAG TPA: PAS domain-containing protein [Burkholderiales bacterium]|nr:PAS domain-containing protein [Burkholderiales bacterium]